MLRRNKSLFSFSNHYVSRPLTYTVCSASFQQQLNSSLQEIKHNKIRNLHICVLSGFRPLLCETLLMCLCSAHRSRNVKARQLRFIGSWPPRNISLCTHIAMFYLAGYTLLCTFRPITQLSRFAK